MVQPPCGTTEDPHRRGHKRTACAHNSPAARNPSPLVEIRSSTPYCLQDRFGPTALIRRALAAGFPDGLGLFCRPDVGTTDPGPEDRPRVAPSLDQTDRRARAGGRLIVTRPAWLADLSPL